MNFLDTYGITNTGTGASTPPSTTERKPEQSLNEEVSQVIGQLGRFWGGFRKQSEIALASARRDFTQVVTQAQHTFEQLATAETQSKPSEAEDGKEAKEEEGEEESDGERSENTPTADTTPPTGTEPGTSATASSLSPSSSTMAQSFFSRLQSSIPPNIVSSVQAQLPERLKNAQQIDLSQLGSSLSSEFQRVQGITRAQAEEYVHKSEALLRDVMKEAGDVLRDAVKVIPPEEGNATEAPITWDGMDFWTLPGLTANASGPGQMSKGKGKEIDTSSGPSSARPSEDARRAVATRAESLLKQLRSNPEIVKLDPAADASKEAYMAWADASEASGEGFGTKVWGQRIAEALSDPSDGAALQATFDSLVPSFMPEEIFWVRYFFRVHQIEMEENRRRALLQATADNEEDFSWEDDEDESVSGGGDAKETRMSAKALASSQLTLAPPRETSALDVLSVSSSRMQSPTRESSEDSYDVVSGNVSSTGAVDAEEIKEGEEEEENEGEEGAEGEESDWE